MAHASLNAPSGMQPLFCCVMLTSQYNLIQHLDVHDWLGGPGPLLLEYSQATCYQ